MSQLIQYIYNSAATKHFSDEELLELLEAARNNNAARNVGGMLLYVDECFFQVLEGEQEQVSEIVEAIRADTRHDKITEIINEPIAKRSFQEWTMGFAQVSHEDLSEIVGLNDFFNNQSILSDLDSGRAKKLLHAFSSGRWRVRLANRAPKKIAIEEVAEASNNPQVRIPYSFAFQPIVDTELRQVIGYEALIRGTDGSPAEQVLQQLPLNEIGEFDVETRRKAIGLANRLGIASKLFLSLAPQADNDTVRKINSTIDTALRCDIDPSRVVLQLWHEAAISDPQGMASLLQDFRRQGMQICISHFGSAHAGLALLNHYKPDMISLASWLLNGIESNGQLQAIFRGLLQTCNDLGVEVIARDVNSNELYNWLDDEGVHLYQGSLFSEPAFESLPRPTLPLSEGSV